MTQNEIEIKYIAKKRELENTYRNKKRDLELKYQELEEKQREKHITDVKILKMARFDQKEHLLNLKIQLNKYKIELEEKDYLLREIGYFKAKFELEKNVETIDSDIKILNDRFAIDSKKIMEDKNFEIHVLKNNFLHDVERLKIDMFGEIAENRKEIEKENQ